MYATHVCACFYTHTYSSKVHKTKLYMYEIQSYDYFKKVTIKKPSVLFHVLKT